MEKKRGVNLSDHATKAIDRNHTHTSAIKEALRDLASNPLLGIPLKGQMAGLRRYRVGRYRITYYFTDETVEIVNVKHRKDAYR